MWHLDKHCDTILAVYPKYYPRGAVIYFLAHHNDSRIEADIRNQCVYLFAVDDIVVGTCTINRNEINRLFVLPMYQGRGYGTKIMDLMEQEIFMCYDEILAAASFPAQSMYQVVIIYTQEKTRRIKMLQDRVERALSLHKKGYNCAQCVVCVYSDVLGLDEKTLFRVAEGFGAGMGDFQGTCGALTGAFMLTGLTTDGAGIDGPKTKQVTYRKVKVLSKAFKDINGSVLCSELKGMTGGSVLRSCDGCIEDAVRIAGEMLVGEGYLI